MSRKIVLKSPGQRHGPITRLISPGDIGQLTKPFVFLDFIEAQMRIREVNSIANCKQNFPSMLICIISLTLLSNSHGILNMR